MTAEKSKGPVKDVRRDGAIMVISVEGDIDLGRSQQFQNSLLALLDEKPRRMVINLAGVEYMDSSGVASLVKLLSRTRKFGIELALAELTARVKSMFEITRLNNVFSIFGSEQEAMN